MDFAAITNYFAEYGLLFLFLIILLEYMNLPGFPAGIIMPAAGVFIAKSEMNFMTALIVSVIAGLIGSWILYCIGRFGGDLILKKYLKKFPSHEDFINKKIDYLREKGYMGILISKLIPMARTVIAIPAGVLKLDFIKYSAYSALGIFIWNGVLISSGYFLGESVLKFLG
ncbi:DedA family protein [Clostridium sp. B9]|uniref:DedA family protein n=1 Tax=Clostridium sp. B9 TaxID=3423224 RepID=UPI003D2EFE9A